MPEITLSRYSAFRVGMRRLLYEQVRHPSPCPPPRDGEGEELVFLPLSASGRGAGGRGAATAPSAAVLDGDDHAAPRLTAPQKSKGVVDALQGKMASQRRTQRAARQQLQGVLGVLKPSVPR